MIEIRIGRNVIGVAYKVLIPSDGWPDCDAQFADTVFSAEERKTNGNTIGGSM